MRFDKVIELINIESIEDGLGGREESENIVATLNSYIEELGIEATMKIYGDATTDTIKAITLGKVLHEVDRIRYENKSYKIISKRFVKNKTCYLLEVMDSV